MKTEIFISETCGLCYGSNRAIEETRETLKQKNNVVLYKEILHNKNVLQELKHKGAKIIESLDEIKPTDFVIVRAHGEPISTFSHFNRNNISYLDCTCPNVKAIHLLVQEKDKKGYKIIIIGKENHPEVIATIGWCNNPILISDEEQIKNLNLNYNKYYLVVQTTFSKFKAESFIEEIKKIMKNNNKIFEYRNTICNAQRNINKSSEELARHVDIMIVIGGKNSSNSKELFNNMSTICKSYFIENPEDVLLLIEDKIIKKDLKIGVTAGASTMKEDIIKTKEILENKLND